MTRSLSKPDTRKYSILPARAIQDDTLGLTTLRVLGALCLHTNAHGVCWPSRETISRHIGGRYPDTISRHFKKLVDKGYLRRLQGKKYSVPRKSRKGYTSRFQVLFDGVKTPLPTYEQFKAIKPRLVAEIDGEAVETIDTKKGRGVRGVETQSLKRAFCAGVERATGVHRSTDTSSAEADAAILVIAGVTPTEILEATIEMSLEARKKGRPPPLSIKQVATWAGLG